MKLPEAVRIDLAAWMTDDAPSAAARLAERVVHQLQSRVATSTIRVRDGNLEWCYREADATLVTRYPNGSSRLRVLHATGTEGELSAAERTALLGESRGRQARH